MDHADAFENPTSKLRYEAFSRLQAAAVGEQRRTGATAGAARAHLRTQGSR
jgi:hypothetical protein